MEIMRDERVPEIVKKCFEEFPHFSDGRVDYSKAGKAPTIITFLRYSDEVLLLKRSDEVGTYRNKWSVVAGYLDELKPVKEKALEEVEEETGISEDSVSSIEIGECFEFNDGEKIWIPHPVLIELEEKPEVELDWEHTEYKWVKEEEVKDYLNLHFLKGLEEIF